MTVDRAVRARIRNVLREREESSNHLPGQFTASSIGHQFVPCIGNRHQLRWSRDHFERLFHFKKGTERISRAVNKDGRHLKCGKVFGTQFRRLLRRM